MVSSEQGTNRLRMKGQHNYVGKFPKLFGSKFIIVLMSFVGSGRDCKCRRTGQQIYSSHC